MRLLSVVLLSAALTSCAGDPPADRTAQPAETSSAGLIPEHAFGSVADPGALVGMLGPAVEEVDGGLCYLYDDIVVVDLTGGDQSGHILVRGGSDCTPDTIDGDMRIDTEAFVFFMALADGYLFLDAGTGPGVRGLQILDVASGRVVYDGPYIHEVNRAETGLYFLWNPMEEAPGPACARGEEWEAAQMTVGFEEQLAVDAESGTIVPVGAITCSMRQ